MVAMWSFDRILVVTYATEDDRDWLDAIGCRTNGNRSTITLYCGNPCVPVFPTEKIYTMLALKYGDRLLQVPVTSREIAEIFNPIGYTPEMFNSK
jgi:hypothetical protein